MAMYNTCSLLQPAQSTGKVWSLTMLLYKTIGTFEKKRSKSKFGVNEFVYVIKS